MQQFPFECKGELPVLIRFLCLARKSRALSNTPHLVFCFSCCRSASYKFSVNLYNWREGAKVIVWRHPIIMTKEKRMMSGTWHGFAYPSRQSVPISKAKLSATLRRPSSYIAGQQRR